MIKIYSLVCLIYNKFFSILESFFLLKLDTNKNWSNILVNGYELLEFKGKYPIKIPERKINLNAYMTKYILNENDILEGLKYFFNNCDLKNIITKKTGFNYSIDYLIYYTTFQVPEFDKNKDLYANKWHYDKPFSQNTLKIIIPLNETENYNGGIEILNFEQTKIFKEGNFTDNEKYFKMTNKMDKILLFLPNRCYHKAGNPYRKEGRTQIMIQLNPSKKWSINKNIYKKQFHIEPKFPYFTYFFDKKIKL